MRSFLAQRVLSLLLAVYVIESGSAAQNIPAPAPAPADPILLKARSLRESGHQAEAIAAFERAFQAAGEKKDIETEAKALQGESACYIRLFLYREALDTAERAYQLAIRANDDTRAGAIAVNKATIYFALGDYDSASLVAEQAVAHLEHSSDTSSLQRALSAEGKAKVKAGHKTEAIAILRRAVTVAHSTNSPELEASAEDYLGEQLLETGDLPDAEKALQEAARLESQSNADPAGLVVTEAHLADLRLHQKKYPEALALIEKVLSSSHYDSAIPRCWPLKLKGDSLSAMGKPEAALAVFTEAMISADRWRRDVLPGDATATGTVAWLSDVYLDYVREAAGVSLRNHNSALGRRALEVLVANRASNLREEMIARLNREMLLPPHYYDLLTNIETMQARVTLGRDPKTLAADKLQLEKTRAELAELENKIGPQEKIIRSSGESNSLRTSLSGIQSHLTQDELLLSFCLGESKSYLWAVTRTQVTLNELPGKQEIETKAHSFAAAVEHREANDAQALDLSRELFGRLGPALRAKRNWLLAPDGALLDGIPFSALPDTADPSHALLIATRTLRLLPSEALRDGFVPMVEANTFLGVADPIYNLADPRGKTNTTLVSLRGQGPGLSLGRLVGSQREVQSSAAASGLPDTYLLTGKDATVTGIKAALANNPEVIHFAVHVVSPGDASTPNQRREAALALSLTSAGIPELLTKETIASWRIPGSLVVLSGCSSQQGEILPSVGLVGLSRAWLLAGASAVLVTAWPTPDDSGSFFQSFYSELRGTKGNIGERAAIALEKAQFDMRSRSGYRSNPAFWSAYSLISKE